MVASPPGPSFFGTRLMVVLLAFEDFVLSHLYYYWCSRAFGPGDYHFDLTEVPTLWVHLYSFLLPFGGTGNFSSGMTLLHHINLCCWYLIPSGVETTYDLQGLSPVWIFSVAGCHRLTLLPSVAILTAGLGVVVAPWHGHHPQHISAP